VNLFLISGKYPATVKREFEDLHNNLLISHRKVLWMMIDHQKINSGRNGTHLDAPSILDLKLSAKIL